MFSDDWMRCWPCRIMDEMRTVLQEGKVEQRVQYIVEGLFKVQRDGFEKSGHSQVPEGLDLLDDADKFEVEIDLETAPDIQQTLNIFKYDPDYEQHEKEWEVRARLCMRQSSGSQQELARQTHSKQDSAVCRSHKVDPHMQQGSCNTL